MDADVIVVGAGLSSQVATAEVLARGAKVTLLDQESAAGRCVLARALPGAPAPIAALLRQCDDVVVADTLPELVDGMNSLTPEPHRLLDPGAGPLVAVRLPVVTRKTPGGLHGHRALEGTLLGGALVSGRVAGRAAAEAVR